MIGYLTIGTNHLARATDFYGNLLGELGAVRAFQKDELGATNAGDPGTRGKNFHAAYFCEMDGNKLNFFCYT